MAHTVRVIDRISFGIITGVKEGFEIIEPYLILDHVDMGHPDGHDTFTER